jgi:hypothetical protein
LAATSATPQHTEEIKRVAHCPTLVAAHRAARPPHRSPLAPNTLVVCSASNVLFVKRVVQEQNPALGNCESCFCKTQTAPTSFRRKFTTSKREKNNSWRHLQALLLLLFCAMQLDVCRARNTPAAHNQRNRHTPARAKQPLTFSAPSVTGNACSAR